MPVGESAPSPSTDGLRERLTIWRFSDGKPGHDNQSLGLAQALASETDCEIHTLAPVGTAAALMCLVTGRASSFKPHPDPDLILGAGHATHLSMLAARRSRGGRAVVLMTPTLPKRLFDLCLIPEHDRPREAGNVIVTRGALNRVRPFKQKKPSSGLILLGGPSANYEFDQGSVLAQVEAVLERAPQISWTAATSRRTPADVITAIRGLKAENLNVVLAEESAPDWLASELGRVAMVWVSEDSASMVFEALSSGAAVGLLSVDRNKLGRVAAGIDKLVSDGLVTRFDDWSNGQALRPPPEALDEASRCAHLVLERWSELAKGAGKLRAT